MYLLNKLLIVYNIVPFNEKKDIISIIQDNDISEYYSLKNLGIEGYAFPYQEALKIVQICKFLVIPILGGDVYSMNNSTIENSDDNWYYDRTPNESFYDYVQNSCNKSESYIRTFKIILVIGLYFPLS